MRYFRREIDVKAIVEAVLKVRELERLNPDVSSIDFTSALGDAYRDWTAEFIDTIADFAERDARVARRIRSWRRARSARALTVVPLHRVVTRRALAPRPRVAVLAATADEGSGT